MIAFRLLVLLCLLAPCFGSFFGEIFEKLGLIDKKVLQVNSSYVEAPSVEIIRAQPLSEAEPTIISVETENHLYHKQILIYSLAAVSVLFLIFATLYCYEVNKGHSMEIERSYSFTSPSQSTLEEASESIDMKDLNEEEL